jgi:hypothetical protein
MIDPPEDADEDPGSEEDVASDAFADTDAPDTDEPDIDPAASSARGRLRAAVALILVVAIVVFGALGGARLVQRNDAESPHQTARLAAIDVNGGLVTMDGLGGSVVEYSAPGVAFQFPVWSPDGAHIAAIGTSIKGAGVYVLGAADPTQTDASPSPGASTGPGATTVVVDDSGVIYRGGDEAPFYAYWSPDNRDVAFLTTEPAGIALRIAPADRSGAATTIREGAPLYWDWVGPGRLYAHVGGSGAEAFLGEMGIDGVADDATIIGHGAPVSPGGSLSPDGSASPDVAQVPGAFRSPAVSRDGRYRAFVETDAGLGQQLVVEARDGSGSHALVVSGITAMAFDSSGGALAFVARDAPQSPFPIGPLRVVDTTSGSSRVLLGGKVVAFFWSPDGRTIATLAVADPGTDGVQALTTHTVAALAGFGPVMAVETAAGVDTAAGVVLHLAFVDVATGKVRSERNVRISDTFTSQVLPYFDQYGLSHRFWSADSTLLALPLVGATGTDQLVVVPADGGDPRQIPGRVIGFWSP